MKRKMICALVVLSVLLASMSTITSTRAADYSKVGVKQGDWAEYAVSSTGHTWNKARLDITGVSGARANLSLTIYYPNGTIAGTETGYANVTSGNVPYWMIAPNLNKDDLIYPASSNKINDTAQMIVAGATRTVNRLVWSSYGNLAWEWDRTTGLTIRFYISDGGWDNYTMTATNMWLPDWVLPVVIGGAVGAVALIAVAVVIIRRRR
ncbi:MAG: hypothetical protein WED05_13015 [Candidatus Atabeyarchaeum deiterrae]